MPSSVCTTAPVRNPSTGLDHAAPIAQADRIVVPVRETESHEEAASGLRPQRIDQLLSQQAHGGRAEDHHSLLLEPNDALIGPKIEELRQLQTANVHLLTMIASNSRGHGRVERSIGFLTNCDRLRTEFDRRLIVPPR